MYREIITKLTEWKESPSRKPLVLRGARQVGKTWILKEFGAKYYENCAYINLELHPELKDVFTLDYDVERIVDYLEVASEQKITKGTALIILDEVQAIPAALTSLKYFQETAPDYHIAVAGSLLGLALHTGTSFPVGKVNFLDLYPMTFLEFLMAVGKGSYAELIQRGDYEALAPFHAQLRELLKVFFVTGGMPEVISNYLAEGNLLRVRDVQADILAAYDQDFSKHAPVNVTPRIREVFDVIPNELARENKKFIFKMIRSSARAKDYDAALLWLEDVGLATRVMRTNAAKIPLSAYVDRDAFKLFMVDVGLLAAKANLPINTILNGDLLFEEFKGALAEQFVFQELKAARGESPYYYSTDSSKGEIDFIIQDKDDKILPIEVKSGQNLSAASLKAFLRKNTSIEKAVKLSLQPYKENEQVINMPLYLAGML